MALAIKDSALRHTHTDYKTIFRAESLDDHAPTTPDLCISF